MAGCSGSPSREGKVDGKAPASAGVRLSPDPAFATSRIDVVFSDRWIDPAKCRFQWRHNNLIIEGAQGSSLEPSQFSKGERISVLVSLADSSGAGPSEWTAQVQVVNTPPKISAVALQMVAPSGVPVLQSTVQSVDPDGDDVTCVYKWFKNDAPLAGEGGSTLGADRLARGDRIAVEVVASDGQENTQPVRSETFTIDNRPPQVTSQPHEPRAADASFRYQVVAVDLDGDPLRYDLVTAPDGMTLDSNGMVVWPLPAVADRHGDQPVSIKVTDPKGGEAVQEFSIPLHAAR